MPASSPLTLWITVVVLLLRRDADAFAPFRRVTDSSTVSLSMAPQYDPFANRWEATTEKEANGYGPVGTLLRQGPVPFVIRVLDQDKYVQGVLKMMANAEDGMSRDEAQGNMDAFLLNPNDWALQKMEEKNGAPKFDYENANMMGEDLVLTAAWSSILLAFVVRIAYVSLTGCDDFCQEYHW
jgi:hypothetical protein